MEEKKSLYVRIRQYFQPYWCPVPKQLKVKKNKKAKVDVENQTQDHNDKFRLVIKRMDRPLEKAFFATTKPKQGEIWHYHSSEKHQVFSYFEPEDRKRFGHDLRDDKARKKLKAKIYPKDEQFDRTHLFPFGYIGTENNPILVIGWRSQHNRVDLMEFENRMSEKNYAIYWLTSIEKTKYGAKWNAVVRRADTNELVDHLELTMGTNTKPVNFYWESY